LLYGAVILQVRLVWQILLGYAQSTAFNVARRISRCWLSNVLNQPKLLSLREWSLNGLAE